MKDISLDLEKFGNGANGAIVAIGAVFFDIKTGETGKNFYEIVSLDSEIKSGAEVEAGTLLWWLSQNDTARSEIINGQKTAGDLNSVLDKLQQFIGGEKVQVWGNGCDYDNAAIAERSRQLGRKPEWDFYRNEHVRTIVRMGREIGFDPKKEMPFTGERHTALADAIHQAQYISAIWQKLIPTTSEVVL